MNNFNLNKKSGFSLMETLVYVAILVVILVILIASVPPMISSFARLNTALDVSNVAEISMERMIRDVRSAESINDLDSVFNTHPGRITLEKATTTETFFFSEGKIMAEEDGEKFPITGGGVVVDKLVFQKADTNHSEAVRIKVKLTKSKGKASSSKRFNASAVTRGSY